MEMPIKTYLAWILLIVFCIFVSKSDLLRVINLSLPFTEAGILSGMILGDRTGFERSFYDQLVRSGLVHLVVVSGSNVMLLVGGVIEMGAKYVGRKSSIIMGFVVGLRYTMLVGWEIPIVRAMLLMSIYYMAQLFGRKYNLTRGLALSVIIMCIGEPKVIMSVSFWLSMMAFVGVATFSDRLIPRSNMLVLQRLARHGKFYKKVIIYIKNIVNVLLNIFWQTVWITIWILPITSITFGRISMVSPLTNLAVLWLVGLISVVGCLGMVTGLIWTVLGRSFLWLTIPSLKYLEMVVGWGEAVPQWQIRFDWWMFAGYYFLLLYFLLKNNGRP